MNLHSADARGEVEGSEGGRLPDMYDHFNTYTIYMLQTITVTVLLKISIQCVFLFFKWDPLKSASR